MNLMNKQLQKQYSYIFKPGTTDAAVVALDLPENNSDSKYKKQILYQFLKQKVQPVKSKCKK